MEQPRFPMRRYWVVLGLLIALTAVPLLMAASAEWILHANGCSFDLEGGTKCIIGESDWGPVLGGLFFWSRVAVAIAMWVTILGAAIRLVVLPVHRAAWKRREGASQ